MKLRNKLIQFMKGRYGPDNLYNFLFCIYIIVFLIDIFINNKILNLLEILIIFIMFYRFFSKNIYNRNKENTIYLNVKKKILKPFDNIKRNIKDKNHVYRKCLKCKTILKLPLPSKKGFNTAICPHCKKKVIIITLKQEKIDIIKNK